MIKSLINFPKKSLTILWLRIHFMIWFIQILDNKLVCSLALRIDWYSWCRYETADFAVCPKNNSRSTLLTQQTVITWKQLSDNLKGRYEVINVHIRFRLWFEIFWDFEFQHRTMANGCWRTESRHWAFRKFLRSPPNR